MRNTASQNEPMAPGASLTIAPKGSDFTNPYLSVLIAGRWPLWNALRTQVGNDPPQQK